MNNCEANSDRLLIETGKLSPKGLNIYNVINVNSDCWEAICTRMDWYTYANFCTTYPQFIAYRFARKNKTLKISHNTNLPIPLIQSLHIIKDVVIESGNGWNLSNYKKEIYRSMNSIEDLSIIKVRYPIDYITSKNIKKLLIENTETYTGRDPMEQDHGEQVLKISENIHTLQLYQTYLSSDSMDHMNKNPIQYLSLYNVAIINTKELTDFFTNANHLTELKMMGFYTKWIQECFLTGPNIIRERIQKMTLHLIPETFQFNYKSIKECKNLEDLTLIYNDPGDLSKFYNHLYRLRKLKTITLKEVINHPSKREVKRLEKKAHKLFNKSIKTFEKRNVKLARYTPGPKQPTFLDAIMALKNE